MKKGLVSIVIINFNSGKYIFQCLEQAWSQSWKKKEIIVVDNQSGDGSGEKLKALAKQGKIKYIYSKENLGSSRANNLGITKSCGEYVLILNADVFLKKDYIEKCIRGFKKDERIGSVVGKLLSLKNKNIIDAAGIVLFREGLGWDRGIGERDRGQYDKEEYVVGACCAAVMYRRDMLEDIKYKKEYYDEDYFAFFEDLDLSVTAIVSGWKTLYYPLALAFHVRGGSVEQVSDLVQYLGYRNSELFYWKSYGNGYILNILLRSLIKFIRLFTVKGEHRSRFRKESLALRERMLKKRRYFAARADHSLLRPYVRHSYILFNLKRRIKRIFRP
ncbi:MAG: glycosyltransferase family 2 protein [Spirochaetes bacterium]|nr:glycosyltransferase family 2 protein [Spirochaetota bacterium]